MVAPRAARHGGSAVTEKLPEVQEQSTYGLSNAEFQKLLTLLGRYQIAMKRDIYKGFKAQDILDFLFTYVYIPNDDRVGGTDAWFSRFKGAFLKYGRNWETVRRDTGSKFMGTGKALMDSVGLMFRFYALTDQLDQEMLEELAGKLKGQLLKMDSLPPEVYEAAFKTTDPGGGRRRLQVRLADDLLGIVITVSKSPFAMGGIRTGLSLASHLAPPGLREVVPYAQKVMEEGLKVLTPYLKEADSLRAEMLALEDAYIRRVIGK